MTLCRSDTLVYLERCVSLLSLHPMKWLVSFVFISMLTSCFTLKEGDILFQDIDCGPYCESIETVTKGYKGADLSHVGLILQGEGGELQVIEANTNGVQLVPVDTFLLRSSDAEGKPKVLVGRLKRKHRALIQDAKESAQALLGSAYDPIYDITDDSYYCSELLYESFKKANGGEPIFDLYPMTFIDPETGELFPIWVEYFESLDHPLPQGELGLNPGGMSTSPVLRIVHRYGRPSGMLLR